jgi:hypothetical protein
MHETTGASWAAFEPWLTFLEDERSRLKAAGGLYVSESLFRGQADAKWRLESTLERHYPHRTHVLDYYRRASMAKNQIEAHTGRSWNPMGMEEYRQYVEETRMHQPPGEATLEYLAYLRHHGFPSPLLDWTQSPFVAAYFALGQASARTERVAIYAFIEHAGFGKGSTSSAPAIRTIGSYIRAHRRHFLQQSEYTLCVVREEQEWRYTSHESAIGTEPEEPQDLIFRFTLPIDERAAALRYLDKFNLNAFSLLGSDESLMETTAFRTLGGE